MIERRRAVRTKVFLAAQIRTARRPPLVIDCVVRDVSPLGARLELRDTSTLPNIFELTFDADRTLRACHVVWRTPTDVGVELVLAANVSSAGCCRRQSKCRRPSCHRRRRSRTPMAWRPHTPGFGAPVRTGWKAGKQYLSVSRRPSHPRTSNAGRGHLVSHTSLAVVGRLRLGAGASSPIS